MPINPQSSKVKESIHALFIMFSEMQVIFMEYLHVIRKEIRSSLHLISTRKCPGIGEDECR
jgi:hypothetical protein